jgi:hypothetical protein
MRTPMRTPMPALTARIVFAAFGSFNALRRRTFSTGFRYHYGMNEAKRMFTL